MKAHADKLRAIALSLLLHACIAGVIVLGFYWSREPPRARAQQGAIEANLVVSSHDLEDARLASPVAEKTSPSSVPLAQTTSEPSPATTSPEQKTDQETPNEQATSSQTKASPPTPTRQESPNSDRLPSAGSPGNSAIPNNPIPSASTGTLLQQSDGPKDALEALRSQYQLAMQHVALASWVHGDEVPPLTHCHVTFNQSTYGEVQDIAFTDCPLGEPARRTIELAMRKNSMPFVGFESVFAKQASIDFCYPEDACMK
jgi:hypothetical protein